MSVKLDTNTATERCQQNDKKLPHETTDGEWCKSERNKEERETPKPTEREKSRTGNTRNSTIKLDATTTELTTKPAALDTPRKTEKFSMIRIAPNCK